MDKITVMQCNQIGCNQGYYGTFNSAGKRWQTKIFNDFNDAYKNAAQLQSRVKDEKDKKAA